MQGGTIFDRATQTGQGVRQLQAFANNPPYNAEWEAIYKKNVELRDKNLFPDVITNCGVPAGFPRMFNLPDPYEFVSSPSGASVDPGREWAERHADLYRRTKTSRRSMGDLHGRLCRPLGRRYAGVYNGRFKRFLATATRSSIEQPCPERQSAGYYRMRKTDANTIQVQLTIEDSKALTKPWAVYEGVSKAAGGDAPV
jgi:hypothetical protein